MGSWYNLMSKLYIVTELDKKPILFSKERLNKVALAEGVYRYYIQATSDGYDPLVIRHKVDRNLYGTIITSFPLKVDKNRCRYLNKMEFDEYVGEGLLSIEEYAKKYGRGLSYE